MKTLGLLGGLTYHATLQYYAQINAHVQSSLPGPTAHSAPLLLHSFDFAEMSALFRSDAWDEVARRLVAAAQGLVSCGARGIVLCVNTGHRVAAELEVALRSQGVEFLHIMDFVAAELKRKGVKGKVGLLGTRIVMEQGFLRERLEREWGGEVLVPEDEDGRRGRLDACIFGDLGRGVVTDEAREVCLAMVKELVGRGAEAVILACTELGFVIKEGDDGVDVPVLDTVALHARGVAEWALEGEVRRRD